MASVYASLADFKNYAVPNATTNTADDAAIGVILESITRFIDRQTCRTFGRGISEARYYTASDAYSLEIDEFVSVSEIKTDDAGLRTYATTWATTDYDLWPYNASSAGEPYRKIEIAPTGVYTFPVGISKGVKVTGIFGWPAVPADIEQACLIAAKSMYLSRFGNNENAAATLTAAGVVLTPQDFPAEAWTLINPYRRRR